MKGTWSLAALLIVAVSAHAADTAEEVNYLRIELGDGFLKKLDLPMPPVPEGDTRMAYDGPGITVVVVITEIPPMTSFVLEDAKRGFVRGLTKTGRYTVVAEKPTSFHGLDAYRLDGIVRIPATEVPLAILLAAGNGFFYQIQILGTEGQLKEEAVESALARLTLTKAQKPQATPEASAPEGRRGWAYEFGRWVGRIFGTVLLAALVVGVFKIVWKRRRRGSPAPTEPHR